MKITSVAVAASILLASGSAAYASTLTVHAGQSIAAAVAAAAPGDTIVVEPGTYHEGAAGSLNALTIVGDDIHLIGNSTPNNPVVLENAGGQSYGIWVSPADTTGAGQADVENPPCAASGAQVHGFVLRGFTVLGFDVHGVHLACAKKFELSRNIADGNQVYGLFPIVSEYGVVARNEVMRTSLDAAIYVGQSNHVAIRDNLVHDSSIGIELENSQDSSVTDNRAWDNSVGIMIDSSPGLTRPQTDHNVVAHNVSRANNLPSQSDAGLPAGIGILINASTRTTLRDNRVTDNGSIGILVSSFVCGPDGCGDPTFDPTANDIHVVDNRLVRNGLAPDPILALFAADLSWDTTGAGNCWSDNRFSTSMPPTLPACTGGDDD